MRFVMALHDGHDIRGSETASAKEIIHGIAGGALFQIIDLLPNPAIAVGSTIVTDITAPGNGDVETTGLGINDAVV